VAHRGATRRLDQARRVIHEAAALHGGIGVLPRVRGDEVAEETLGLDAVPPVAALVAGQQAEADGDVERVAVDPGLGFVAGIGVFLELQA